MEVETCSICRGSKEPGWVCEDHPDRPWEHDGCEGAGAPCGCNPMGVVGWREIYAEERDGRPEQ
jgi:hypothetical protein